MYLESQRFSTALLCWGTSGLSLEIYPILVALLLMDDGITNALINIYTTK